MQPKRILIAEDEKYMRLTLELIVERLGHVPLCAADGKEALEMLIKCRMDNTPVNLLLCDILMPGMSGTELIETMHKRNIAVPVLVITGYGDKELVVQLMRMGCRDFIDKPFAPDEIEKRIALLINDINSREAEEQRLKFFASVGESARSFIHDINNAVGGVYGYADVLMEQLPEGHPLRAKAAKIFSSAARAVEICRELLSQRVTDMEGRRIRTDVNLLVERSAALLSDVLPESIRVKTDARRRPAWYAADAAQLQQALLNLGFNAADAMPDGGELFLKITVHDRFSLSGNRTFPFNGRKCLSITVSDTGTGIAPENLPHIFDDGFSTRKKGNGIGLTTVKRIVEAHGGLIDVDSKPGGSARFHLVFPLEEKSARSNLHIKKPSKKRRTAMNGQTAPA